jgi:hypothetical protein
MDSQPNEVMRSAIRQSGEFRKWAWTIAAIMQYILSASDKTMLWDRPILMSSVASYIHLYQRAIFRMGIVYIEFFREYEDFFRDIVSFHPVYVNGLEDLTDQKGTWYTQLDLRYGYKDYRKVTPSLFFTPLTNDDHHDEYTGRHEIEMILRDENIRESTLLVSLRTALEKVDIFTGENRENLRRIAVIFHVIRFYYEEERRTRFAPLSKDLQNVCDGQTDTLN